MENPQRSKGQLIFNIPFPVLPEDILAKLFELTETLEADVFFLSEFESELADSEVKQAIDAEVEVVRSHSANVKNFIIKSNKAHLEFTTTHYDWLVKECRQMFITPSEDVPHMTIKIICDEFEYIETDNSVTVKAEESILDELLKEEDKDERHY